MERIEGTVVRRVIPKKFGFIRATDDGVEYFYHETDIVNATFETLEDGNRVSFTPKTTPKGPRADEVQRLG